MRNIALMLFLLLFALKANAQTVTVSTFAGSGTQGSADGTGTAASFKNPYGVAVDASGNIYVSDTENHKIRKITPSGVVSTFAGSGTQGSADGTGTAASFNLPVGVAVDASGNIYVADRSNHDIRKITPSGVVSTFAGSGTQGSADGTGTAASFKYPSGVAVDASGNIYVSDTSNHKIRKITPAGVVSTFAGSGTQGSADGTGTAASFNIPASVVVDASGNIYVSDYGNHKIRKITSAGVVSTFAGSGVQGSADGTGTAASFKNPYGVAMDASGNIYVADYGNHKIRKTTPSGVVSTLAGSGTQGSADGTGTAASFNAPSGVAADASGNIYVADTENHKIRKITVAASLCPTGNVTLTTQAQVDQFIIDYPTCTTINGNLTIEGNDITNLNGLINLQTVTGQLNIVHNTSLTDITGLTSLKNVNGNLWIADNNTITTFNNAFGSLETAGQLYIGDNPHLMDIGQFNALTTVTWNLVIQNNPELTNVNLSGLTSVGGNFTFQNNAALTTFASSSLTSIGGEMAILFNPVITNVNVSGLTSVGGNLTFQNNAALTNVSLSSLTSVGGSLNIKDTALTNVNGLSSLTSVGKDIDIRNNVALSDISALQNTTFNPDGIYGLTITDNPALAVCNLPNFCSYLANPAGTHPRDISGNLAQCVNEAAVVAACGTLSLSDIDKTNIKIYPNPVKQTLNFSEEVSNIRITDVSGRTVKEISVTGKSADVSKLANGTYIITGTTKAGKLITKKIVKE